MAVNYIGDNPLAPPAEGTVVELRQTLAVVQDRATRRRWAVSLERSSQKLQMISFTSNRNHRRERNEGKSLSVARLALRQAPKRATWSRRQPECQQRLDCR